MDEFPLEAVPNKDNVAMPSKDNVAEIRNDLWQICAKGYKKRWDLDIPFCDFKERGRNASDPEFRPEDFEGRKKGVYDEGARTEDFEGRKRSVYDEEAIVLGRGGLDLLGRYRFKDSMVTIYIDSCRKVEQWCDVSLDQLVHVVLVHELAHLMTHRGFGVEEKLCPHFWEYTAQCATYAYLQRHNKESLKVFKKLSPYQPFIYQTWESLEALHAPSGDKFEALVKDVFSAFANVPLDERLKETDEMHTITRWDE